MQSFKFIPYLYDKINEAVNRAVGYDIQADREYIGINSDNDGSNPDYSEADSTVSIYFGNIIQTGWTVSIINEENVTVNLVSQTATVTNITSDTGSFTFRAENVIFGITRILSKKITVSRIRNGAGWTSGSYNASNGIVTFTSDDGLGFQTGDLRGADGLGAPDNITVDLNGSSETRAIGITNDAYTITNTSASDSNIVVGGSTISTGFNGEPIRNFNIGNNNIQQGGSDNVIIGTSNVIQDQFTGSHDNNIFIGNGNQIDSAAPESDYNLALSRNGRYRKGNNIGIGESPIAEQILENIEGFSGSASGVDQGVGYQCIAKVGLVGYAPLVAAATLTLNDGVTLPSLRYTEAPLNGSILYFKLTVTAVSDNSGTPDGLFIGTGRGYRLNNAGVPAIYFNYTKDDAVNGTPEVQLGQMATTTYTVDDTTNPGFLTIAVTNLPVGRVNHLGGVLEIFRGSFAI